MNRFDLPDNWAARFGLAAAPLFSQTNSDETHIVLLDGSDGSFALSITEDQVWRDKRSAQWSWSSNLPHHVTVTNTTVAVTRWDKLQVDLLSRASVEKQIDSFYAYLIADKVRSNQRVVEHILGLYRRVRSLVAAANFPDTVSVDAFLQFLNRLIALEGSPSDSRGYELNSTENRVLESLPANGIDALIADVQNQSIYNPFLLLPTLAVRHAGSEIFQEAHFEFMRSPSLDLLGYVGPAETNSITRGGAHFTPPALARSVAEQTFRQVENLNSRRQIVISDYACGSGAFLHEAVRTLQRLDFTGKIIIVGRDISAAAVAMANFVIQQAAGDWTPKGGLLVDIIVTDSLSSTLPKTDVVLMNPPFISWSALNTEQRDQMTAILGTKLGRSDFSMAFVSRALDSMNPGGALGVLLPASLLTLNAAKTWRDTLLERSELRLLASLGDYGLFAHALVQVCALVLAVPSAQSSACAWTVALTTKDDPHATSSALRALRRTSAEASVDGGEEWSIFRLPSSHYRKQANWRINSPDKDLLIRRLRESDISQISKLFDVRQGVRSGENSSFILSNDAIGKLPVRERAFFKPALVNDSINNGLLDAKSWIFYPYNIEGPLINSEAELEQAVPTYLRRFLIPNKERLLKRASLTQAGRKDWWGLSRDRSSWALSKQPKIVSKYFGARGGFGTDLVGHFIVVQGFAWIPKWTADFNDDEDDEAVDLDGETIRGELPLNDVISAYAALMNSSLFSRLLAFFSPHVAGGQFDLSSRHVSQIPLPDLTALSRDERTGRLVSQMSELGRKPRLQDADWSTQTDGLTAEMYGGDFFSQF